MDGLSTDISLSESMTFDSCSLNEDQISELPTTPEDASANITAEANYGSDGGNSFHNGETSESSSTLCGSDVTSITATTSCISSTLPSKLDKLEKLDWDEIDDLLQVQSNFFFFFYL